MTLSRRFVLCAVAALAVTASRLPAAEPAEKPAAPAQQAALPRGGEIQSLTVHPTKMTLRGLDDAQQVVLTATLKDGRQQDLTSDATYELADAKVARVSSGGRVSPLANGSSELTIRYDDKVVKVAVAAEACDQNLPINFANQVVPIFTKLGCNSGGCHGKASGQGGFKLSLLGFEPEIDFTSLVKEGRGRRTFPAAPERSLLLLKAAGGMAHGGGKRLDVGSDEYRLLKRWVAAGLPWGKPTDPVVKKVTVLPERQVMTRHNKQQFAVYAHYSDGTVEDITRRAQYETNDPEVAVVEPSGLVRTLNMSGEAAIMVRYQEHVTAFRATVPLGGKTPSYEFAQQTVVDKHTQAKWQQLGLVPSGLCSDEQFIRRVSLDLTGTLPTPEKVKAFLDDKDPKKRDKLIDDLLESPEYSYYFAGKWADILRVKRRQQADRAKGTFAFHNWIRTSIAQDKPYDQFTAEILAATGDENTNPPTVWYKELSKPQEFVDDMAQVFLGLRLACAQCHHHPYEKWSQDDYWGLAAFFGRIGRKQIPEPGRNPQRQNGRVAIYTSTRQVQPAVNTRTGQPATMKPLDGEPMDIPADEDPRQKLVEWMTNAKNPFFARSVANRYWAHFFGRGIVDPLDDMRITNPPSNPELLDALAKELVDNKFSLKHLIKTIVKSRTYQLSSLPNEFNKDDKQNYARYYPKRLTAEVLFDAVCQVTASPAQFQGLPQDKFAPNRAIMLPDESFTSYFLDVFGRTQRNSACECERVNEANLAQMLHMLNSDEIQGKLTRGGGRAALLAADKRPDAEKIEELFLWALTRKPDPEQMKIAMEIVEKNDKNKQQAYVDILWALLNTKEFMFNQ